MTTSSDDLVKAEWADVVDAIEQCYERGWTDGLPVVPPTAQRVQMFLDYVGRSASEVVGGVPERRREVTVGKLAANAVMAGCKPEYFPVVLAVADAIFDPLFNLIGPSSSLGGAGILVIVNGPVVKELGINCGNNLFGPGNRANSTIGRSVRLILMNACAAIPGLFDRSILGHPGKFSFCIAENEEDISWTPLHVERGFSKHDSAVTVFACDGPRQVRVMGAPDTMLYSLADSVSSLGSSMASSGSVGEDETLIRQGQVVIVFAGAANVWDGWSKDDIRAQLFPDLKRSMADLKRAKILDGPIEDGDAESYLSLVPTPEDLLMLYAGGVENQYMAVIPPWGPKVGSTAVTKLVHLPKS